MVVFGLGLRGLTVRVAGLAAAVCAYPSDQVTVHGPVPVNTACNIVGSPLQIVALPLTTEVGRGLTVTVNIVFEPAHPLAVDATVTVAVTGAVPALAAV
ncbi:MAG: hypothetical protein DME23_01945 [Verrucomicrobia bacterium]|nr:MAG: hypothetical protein DME23_01945 [Verrucomicrobiota bacterium]